MATLTERLALIIDARTSGATKEISKLTGATKTAGKEADKTEKKYREMSTALKVGIGVAAGVVGAKLIRLTGDAVKAASDLAETQNKVNVVFGESADVVNQLGETSAKSLGLSENAAEGAAAAFGAMFKTTGLANDEAANMSVTMVGLAADMASFNNQDPSEMLDRLRSGLAGEAEPLRQFGILLSEARVKSKAMELGLADANGELSEGAKVQARYALILEDTKLQQGDFARTADGLANQQRIMNAEWEDAKAKLGAGLLPIMTDAVGVASKLAGAFGDMDPQLRAVLLGMTGLTTAAVLAIPAIKGVTGALGALGISASTAAKGFGIVGLAITEVTQAANLGTEAWDVWGDSQLSVAEKMNETFLTGIKVSTFGLVDFTKETKKSTGSSDELKQQQEQLAQALYQQSIPAVQGAAEATAELYEKQQLLNGALVTATERQIAFADHLADGVEKIKDSAAANEDNATSLSLTNQAGRDNVSWLIDAIKLANDHAAAKAEETGSLQKANEALNSDVRALKKAATAAGLNATEVQKLIDKYLKIPKNVNTKVKATVSGLSQLQTLSNIITTLNGIRVNIPVSALTARQHGGPVAPNRAYLVGEGGRPEILYNNRVYPSGRTPPALSSSATMDPDAQARIMARALTMVKLVIENRDEGRFVARTADLYGRAG